MGLFLVVDYLILPQLIMNLGSEVWFAWFTIFSSWRVWLTLPDLTMLFLESVAWFTRSYHTVLESGPYYLILPYCLGECGPHDLILPYCLGECGLHYLILPYCLGECGLHYLILPYCLGECGLHYLNALSSWRVWLVVPELTTLSCMDMLVPASGDLYNSRQSTHKQLHRLISAPGKKPYLT